MTSEAANTFICIEIPLADAGSLTTGPSADNQMGFEIGRLPKANWRIRRLCCPLSPHTKTQVSLKASLARIIVYSMATDGMPTPASNMPTPFMTPLTIWHEHATNTLKYSC